MTDYGKLSGGIQSESGVIKNVLPLEEGGLKLVFGASEGVIPEGSTLVLEEEKINPEVRDGLLVGLPGEKVTVVTSEGGELSSVTVDGMSLYQ